MKWKRRVPLVVTFTLLAFGSPYLSASGSSPARSWGKKASGERPAVYVA